MIFLIILFFLFQSKSVFATADLQITLAPTNLIVGTTFPVQFTIQNSDPNISYHYKFFGGIGDIKTQIQTASNLYFNGTDWNNFPTFTTDIGGSGVVNTFAYIGSSNPVGVYNLFIKIVKEDDHSKLNIESNIPYIINNVTTPPTCTYTYSDWGTCTSSSTQTRTYTSTPSGCTGTPVTNQSCTYIAPITPTLTPTSTTKPTPTPTDEPIPTAVIEPLDVTTTLAEEIPTPTITQIPSQELILSETTTSKKNPLPLIFICIGGLFLLTPLIISKIKHGN